ncbi:unnamed protein product [Pedinophyceae sp. YPF-701]|nr:unnamed protein product [Pedinophyceae sp. YPF-701]
MTGRVARADLPAAHEAPATAPAAAQDGPAGDAAHEADHAPAQPHPDGNALEERASRHAGDGDAAPRDPDDDPACPIYRPSMPKLIRCDASAVHVRWDPPQMKAGQDLEPEEIDLEYSLEVQLADAQRGGDVAEGAWREVYRGTCNVQVVPGLLSGRLYAVRVSAHASTSRPGRAIARQADPSRHLLASTLESPPLPPKHLALTQRKRTSLTVKWDPPGNVEPHEVTAFRAYLYPPPAGHPDDGAGKVVPLQPTLVEAWRGDGGARRAVLSGLQPGVAYWVAVSAESAAGVGPQSAPVQVATAASVPSAPAAPRVAGQTTSSLRLAWAAPAANGAPITSYTVERDDGGGYLVVYVGPDTTHQALGLEPGRTYRFRVRAENDEGRSEWSPAVEARPAPSAPAAPPPPTVSGRTAESATLAWRSVSADGGTPVYMYELHVKRDGAREWEVKYRGEARAATVHGLLSGASYVARVAAVNAAGTGPPGASVSFRTMPAAPAAPGAPRASFVTTSSIQAEWNAPAHDGGSQLTSYRVECADGGCCPVDSLDSSEHSVRSATATEGGECLVPSQRASSDAAVTTALGDFEEHLRWETVYQGSSCHCTVQGLQPGRRYFLRTTAFNSEGASPASPTVFVPTRGAPPAPPPGLTVASSGAGGVSHSALELSWGVPAHNGATVTGYTLEMLPPEIAHAAGGGAPGRPQHHRLASGATGATSPRSRDASVAAGESDTVPLDQESEADLYENLSSVSSRIPAQVLAPPPVWTQVYRGPHNAYVAQGLEPDAEYTFRVCAANRLGRSAWSQQLTVRTAPVGPSPPVGVHCVSRGANELVVRWEPPLRLYSQPVLRYVVERHVEGEDRGGGARRWVQVYSGERAECKLSGLPPGGTVAIRVQAVSAVGPGQPTAAVILSTDSALPDPPGKPTVAHASSNMLKVQWDEPASDNGAVVTRYDLYMLRLGPDGDEVKLDADDPGFELVHWGLASTRRIQGLDAGHRYAFKVRAWNASGPSDFSAPVVGATTARAVTAVPRVTARPERGEVDGCTRVVVQCRLPGPPAPDVEGYEVEVLGPRGDVLGVVRCGPDGEGSVDVSGASPGSSLGLRARCCAAAAPGDPDAGAAGPWGAAGSVVVPREGPQRELSLAPDSSAETEVPAALERAPSTAASSSARKRRNRRKAKGSSASMASIDGIAVPASVPAAAQQKRVPLVALPAALRALDFLVPRVPRSWRRSAATYLLSVLAVVVVVVLAGLIVDDFRAGGRQPSIWVAEPERGPGAAARVA